MKFFIFLLLTLSLYSLERRAEPQPMKLSVIIPCAGQHADLLPALLKEFCNQTSLPDEIVISLSSIEHLDRSFIDSIEQGPWPFALKILRFEGKQSPGLNRNLAAKASKGEIILSQDADDLPHRQRVEIVRYVFENYFVDHLLHKWLPEGASFSSYEADQTEVLHFDRYDQIYECSAGDYLHNGNNASSRAVVDAVQWIDVKSLDGDQDVRFNREVYDRFSNTAVISCSLLMYRWRFSALQNNNAWP